jgi:diaminopimelate epimerase
MSRPVAGGLPVAKAHAYGNDFLYVPRSDVSASADLPALARALCHRHTGLGADGLILYAIDDTGTRMTLLNADGSPAEVSGNGVRGLAALIVRRGLPGGGTSIAVHTDAGEKRLELLDREGETRSLFRAAMGEPADLREVHLDVSGEQVRVVQLFMGNPQAVVLGGPLDNDRLQRLGAALQRHPACPSGTNLELAEVTSPGEVRILIYERGVGPTSSSGTGSCAAAVAAAAYGSAARDVQVVAPGGTQRVEWRDDGVYLTGWAEVVFEGRWLGSR